MDPTVMGEEALAYGEGEPGRGLEWLDPALEEVGRFLREQGDEPETDYGLESVASGLGLGQ